MKDYSDYPHRHYDIHVSLNHTIDMLEDNQKAFNTRLEKGGTKPHSLSKPKITNAIAHLKQARDILGSVDWL